MPTTKAMSATVLPENQQERFTLEEAFDYFYEADGMNCQELNLKRAVLSVSFLLRFLSDTGNNPVDGFAANGLACVLEKCAADTSYVRGPLVVR